MRYGPSISALGLVGVALAALAPGVARSACGSGTASDLAGLVSELRSGAIEPERRAALESAVGEGLGLGGGFRFELSDLRPIDKARCGTELLSGTIRHPELPPPGVICKVHPSLEWRKVGSLACIVDEPRSSFAREEALAARHYRAPAFAAALQGVLDAARALRSRALEPQSIWPYAGASAGPEPWLELHLAWHLPRPEPDASWGYSSESAPWVGQLGARLALDVACARPSTAAAKRVEERDGRARAERPALSVDGELDVALRLLAELDLLPGRTSVYQPAARDDSFLVWRDLPLPRGASMRIQLVARLEEEDGQRVARVQPTRATSELPVATLAAALRRALSFADLAGEKLGLLLHFPPAPQEASLGTIFAIACPLEDEPLRTSRVRILRIELPVQGEPVARELELHPERRSGPVGNERWRAALADDEILELRWVVGVFCAEDLVWPPSAVLGSRQGEVFGGTGLLGKP